MSSRNYILVFAWFWSGNYFVLHFRAFHLCLVVPCSTTAVSLEPLSPNICLALPHDCNVHSSHHDYLLCYFTCFSRWRFDLVHLFLPLVSAFFSYERCIPQLNSNLCPLQITKASSCTPLFDVPLLSSSYGSPLSRHWTLYWTKKPSNVPRYVALEFCRHILLYISYTVCPICDAYLQIASNNVILDYFNHTFM
jgi:hypothetical protein